MSQIRKLYDAVYFGNLEKVKELVAGEIDVNVKTNDETPLHAAILGEREETKYSSKPTQHSQVVKLLLERKADITKKNREGKPIIHTAVSYGSLQILNTLLEHQANVEQREDERNMTPLITAASSTFSKKEEKLELLLTHKANVNAQDKLGRTALCQAIRNEFSAKSISTLIEQKADVLLKDENDIAPIHYAAYNNNAQQVELLLEKKTNVNQQDKKGETPFHKVLLTSHFSLYSFTITTLLEHKADVNLADKKGETPIRIAYRSRHKQGIEIAKKYTQGATAGALSEYLPKEMGMYIGSFFSMKEGGRLAQVNKAAVTMAKEEATAIPKIKI